MRSTSLKLALLLQHGGKIVSEIGAATAFIFFFFGGGKGGRVVAVAVFYLFYNELFAYLASRKQRKFFFLFKPLYSVRHNNRDTRAFLQRIRHSSAKCLPADKEP